MVQRDPRPVFEKLRSLVLPAVEGYWRADVAVATFLDSSLSALPSEALHFSCGRSALSSLFGEKDAERALGGCGHPWTNRRTMENALRQLGVPFEKRKGGFPDQGLALIQWNGDSMGRDYRGSNLVHTHWVAVVERFIFDVNWRSWLPLHCWEELVAQKLMASRHATGWSVLTGYQIH